MMLSYRKVSALLSTFVTCYALAAPVPAPDTVGESTVGQTRPNLPPIAKEKPNRWPHIVFLQQKPAGGLIWWRPNERLAQAGFPVAFEALADRVDNQMRDLQPDGKYRIEVILPSDSVFSARRETSHITRYSHRIGEGPWGSTSDSSSAAVDLRLHFDVHLIYSKNGQRGEARHHLSQASRPAPNLDSNLQTVVDAALPGLIAKTADEIVIWLQVEYGSHAVQ
ncbi:hypothetical protein LMG19083_04680 [Ralstonia psammae]|uniref:DUF4136 domain-containing protein n=1 Tax=Ralstonia psammae TaxID=3058598 RepID=A0ABN9JDU2_9RALS|nr:hypothetical protein [Ralstonia sp. LMG 19083]CAJ0808269.1 hypothetical protein LMG19083_04680 [Ralstonia sp. LMG 19083]